MPERTLWNFPARARLAVYCSPPRRSPWWAAGCLWLGRDAESGERLSPPEPPDLATPLAALTAEPSRYGWHATLVPPFHPGNGVSAADVAAVAARWALTQSADELALEPGLLRRFAALQPADRDGAARMRELAASALLALAPLRAPPTPEDLARRWRAHLSERQRALLAQWHYPYVLDEYRFHLTLTGPLEREADERAVLHEWRARVARLGPLPVEEAAIFVEPGPGQPFVLWRRLPFGAKRA